MKYYDRIKKLRKESKVTQKQLAELLDVSLRNIQYIEAGKQNLNQDQLIIIADFFDVSLDYLVGRSDDPKRY